MKFLLTFCLIASLATVALTSSASYGTRVPNDYLLDQQTVYRDPINNNYWDSDVYFPRHGETNKTITNIIVFERLTNSSGAHPSLVSGGPGYKFAIINLRSQFGRGIFSEVQFYGK